MSGGVSAGVAIACLRSEKDSDRNVVPPKLTKVTYTYRVQWVDTGIVQKHFRDRARAAGSEADFYGCMSCRLDVETGGEKWAIDVFRKRRGTYEIDLKYSEQRPPSKW